MRYRTPNEFWERWKPWGNSPASVERDFRNDLTAVAQVFFDERAELRRQRDEAVNVAKHLLGALMVVRSTYGPRHPEDAEIWLRTINGAEKRIARVEGEPE